MAKDLEYLATRLTAIAKGIPINSRQLVGAVAEAVGPVLIEATPVDTGRARANWRGGVGSPETGVLFTPPMAPPSPDAGASIALSSIIGAAIQYKGQKAGISIANNLDYIASLNNGSSKQAPSGFVYKAVVAGIAEIKTHKLVIK